MCLRLAKIRHSLILHESVKYTEHLDNMYWWKVIVTFIMINFFVLFLNFWIIILC